MIKIIKLAKLGITVSFDNNFKASANACNAPNNPTVLGPLLRCMEANTLRSKTVKKATANNKGNKKIKKCNQLISKIKKTIIKTKTLTKNNITDKKGVNIKNLLNIN